MSEGDSGPHLRKPIKLPLPPVILGVGSLLWKFIDVVAKDRGLTPEILDSLLKGA